MTLVGDQISLRAVEPSDVDRLYKWENDASLWNDSCAVVPYSKYHLQQYIETAGDLYVLRQLRLMIELNDTHETVGCIDLIDFEPRFERAEIAVLVDKAFQRKGYATEAVEMMKKYASDFLHLHQLYAYVGEDNEASLRLFDSTGFEKIVLLKDWCRDKNWRNCWLLQLIF